MESQSNYNATILRINGLNIDNLVFLANVYEEPMDPDEITSMVATLTYSPEVKWDAIYSAKTWLTSMDRSKKGHIFTVSMDGELHTNRAGKWEIINIDCPDGLNDVWCASDNEVFAVGIYGERVQVLGKNINITRDKIGRRLNAVHGSTNKNVFAVGDGGLIFMFNGDEWIELEQATNYNLLAVLCISETECYIAGSKGILLRWDGNYLETIESSDITITSLTLYEKSLYASAGKDGIFVLEGNKLESLKDLRLYRLKTIDDLLFGVGNKLVVRYDGTNWRGGELDLY